MDLDLAGRRVAVLGSTRGIGRAIAEALLQEGARVTVTGRDRLEVDQARRALAEAHGAGRVLAFSGDLGAETGLADLRDACVRAWDGVDHLVCNIGSGRSVPPLTEDEAEWRRMLDINLLGATQAVRVFSGLLEATAASGADASAVCVSSICGVEALGCPVAYATAKSALAAYCANAARHYGPRGVRLNTVSPGNVIFPGSTWEEKVAREPEAVEAVLRRDVPLGRLARADEIAGPVVFLLSRQARFVTGANWIVDGGQTRSV